MSRNLSDENIFRTTKKILGLASLALVCAGPTLAQSKLAQAETAVARAAAPAQDVAQNSSAKPSAPKGDSEGIKVHGHWVIEVKNPDGKVVTRREFENAIQPFGMSYLAALLAGNNSPGGLSILLNGKNSALKPYGVGGYGYTQITFVDPGPCLPLLKLDVISGQPFAQTGGPSTGTTCLIAIPTTYLGSVCSYAQAANASPLVNLPSPCSTLLTTTAPTLNATISGSNNVPAVQLVLNGSVLVSSSIPGSVNDVETWFTTCDTNTTPTTCINYVAQSSAEGFPAQVDFFTMRQLDGQGGDPPAVPYTPGQSITATVTISFQ